LILRASTEQPVRKSLGGNTCPVGPIDQSKHMVTTKGYAGTVKINGLS
jgi:hypothetical protein